MWSAVGRRSATKLALPYLVLSCMFFFSIFSIYGRMTLRCETWSSSLHPHKFKENPCYPLIQLDCLDRRWRIANLWWGLLRQLKRERKKNITFKLRPWWQSFIKLRSEATDKNLNQISWKFANVSHRIPHKTNNSLKKKVERVWNNGSLKKLSEICRDL